jgi:hypothetical protein
MCVMILNDLKFLGFLISWLAMASKHTLVCHPIGWHIDVFANNGKDCIENKVCLLSRSRSKWVGPEATMMLYDVCFV